MVRKAALTVEEYTYTVVFEPDEEAGGCVVSCPALPGLVAEGDTPEEARAMAADAIACYLESLRKDGLPAPESDTGRDPIADRISVRLEPA
jgi:predicted RNase H-like HicB family nuclease